MDWIMLRGGPCRRKLGTAYWFLMLFNCNKKENFFGFRWSLQSANCQQWISGRGWHTCPWQVQVSALAIILVGGKSVGNWGWWVQVSSWLLVGGYVGMSVCIAITWKASTSVGISTVFVGIRIYVGIKIFVGININSRAARLEKRNI